MRQTSSYRTVRNYQKQPGSCYGNYSAENLQKALEDVKAKRLTVSAASRTYNVPRTTLQDKMQRIHSKSSGGKTIFSALEEESFKQHFLTLASYGFPLTTFDLRLITKSYLDTLGKKVDKFSNDTPGKDWAYSFLKRHRDLTQRFSANIKRSRAEKSPEEIKKYVDNLKDTIPLDTPPENIYNYDETNLTDDPLNKRVVIKRGTKYPERVMNSSKSSTSVMFCGTAAGELLAPYVVYKSEHLWTSWIEGGLKDARYNRTKSGWFDAACFEDWFVKIALPDMKKKKGGNT